MYGLLNYLMWNALLLVPLIASYYYNFPGVRTVLSVFYAFEAFCYTILVLAGVDNPQVAKTIKEVRSKLKLYKFFLELIPIALALYFDYKFIAMCMTVTEIGYAWLLTALRELDKREREEVCSEPQD